MSLQKQSPPKVAGSADAIAGRAGQKQINPIETLLQRLEGVKPSRNGWRAKCPSCGGESSKVSIAEADNGSILLHAFCGCPPGDVLGAVGLQLSDLFPAPLRPMNDTERREARRRIREIGWAAALSVINSEASIVLVASQQLARWQILSEKDDARLQLACDLIGRAKEVLNVR